jgi:branched-chain amino acid transport system permease protein
MSAAWQSYAITLLVYTGVNTIAVWALNMQFGLAGILNFAFIVYQAAGAYAAAVLTLGSPAASGNYQSYILGFSWPWPLPWLAGAAAGAGLAALVGLFALRPERRDYQAMVMLIVSIAAISVVSAETGLFNGATGLASIPKPLVATLGLGLLGYGWFYVGLTVATCVVVYAFVHKLTGAPWARRLRAIRENPDTAAALGINVRKERMTVFIVGGGLAGLSGAVLVQYIGAWAPGGWEYAETFIYFTAVIVGGTGNNFGVMLGSAIVLTGILNSVQFLPNFGAAGFADAMQWVAVGVLILLFLWFRPGGLVPERRRRFAIPREPTPGAPASDVGS